MLDQAAAEEPTVPAAQYAKRGDELCRRVAVQVIDLRIQRRLRQAQDSPGTEAKKLTQRRTRSGRSSCGSSQSSGASSSYSAGQARIETTPKG